MTAESRGIQEDVRRQVKRRREIFLVIASLPAMRQWLIAKC